jgi:chorismate synthase
LSSGMPVDLRVAFKPTASISKEQRTVDLTKKQDATVKVQGRHDPCIVPRAVVVVEAAAALVIADLLLRGGFFAR